MNERPSDASDEALGQRLAAELPRHAASAHLREAIVAAGRCLERSPGGAPPFEMTIGTRFNMDWKVKPIARFFFGRASPMTAKIAGLAMLCQAIANPSPKKRNGHEGLSR